MLRTTKRSPAIPFALRNGIVWEHPLEGLGVGSGMTC
ncbi:hypothetical protein SSPIM334S_07952 [Streptomyces spiroverticillatus]